MDLRQGRRNNFIEEDKIMGMEISNTYSSYAGNSAYAAKVNNQKQTTESRKTGKTGVEAQTAARKTATAKKGSLLNQLQKKYSDFDITEGSFSQNQISSQGRGFKGVMISPAYLAKAENSEKTAKELDEMLSGVESAQKWLESAFQRDGLELVSCGYFINENGEMGSYSVVKKKDSMFDGLAEQSEKSADRLKEKQEKAEEQKKVDEKKAERREAEKKQEKQVKSPGNKLFIVASSNEELLEKAKAAANSVNEKESAKEEQASGSRFDYSI